MDSTAFTKIRKYLHQHPEVSEQESETSLYIELQLKSIWPEIVPEKIDHHNLIFTLGKLTYKSQHLAFRCELDALPIQEQNNFDHASKIQGVSHKCGHDGHMAIMLRFAYLLKTNPIANTTISLIFQSAEENGVGADQITSKSLLFKNDKPDYIFALHNVPGYPKSAIVVKEGIFTPTVVSVKAIFDGKTAHAAEPEKGINPAITIAKVLIAVQEKVDSKPSIDALIMAPVEMSLGKDSYGTSAGQGMLGLTIRSYDPRAVNDFKLWYEALVNDSCITNNLKFEIIWFEAFDSIINDKAAVATIVKAATAIDLEVIHKTEPFSWGEDFSKYTESIEGTMFGLGSGKDHPALHNPDYDFPDELIESGSNMFYTIINALAND